MGTLAIKAPTRIPCPHVSATISLKKAFGLTTKRHKPRNGSPDEQERTERTEEAGLLFQPQRGWRLTRTMKQVRQRISTQLPQSPFPLFPPVQFNCFF